MPVVALGKEGVGFLGAPGVPRVEVHRDGVVEDRVDNPPCGLHGVLPGEEHPLRHGDYVFLGQQLLRVEIV